jgi:hypothetical protein
VFVLPPLGRIEDFRQEQGGLDRIENFVQEEHLVKRVAAAVVNIGEKFLGSPFRRDTLTELCARSGHADHFDFRIGFLKFPGVDYFSVAGNVKRDLPLFLGGFDGFIPLRPPRLGSFAPRQRTPDDRTGNDEKEKHPCAGGNHLGTSLRSLWRS